MATITDFSVVNLILKELEECRRHLHHGALMRSLYALVHALKLRIHHQFRPENEDLIDKKIYKMALAVTESPDFHKHFGPVSVVLGENKTLYDFINSLISAELEISGETREDLLAKAQHLLDHGDFDKARDLLNSLLIGSPDDLELRMEIGDRYLNKQLYEDAELVFREAQGLDPSSIHVINRLGIAFRKMGRYDDAIAEYIKAIKLAPDDPHLYYNLAVALYSKQDYPKALMTVERALRLSPDFPEGIELKKQIEKKMGTSS